MVLLRVRRGHALRLGARAARTQALFRAWLTLAERRLNTRTSHTLLSLFLVTPCALLRRHTRSQAHKVLSTHTVQTICSPGLHSWGGGGWFRKA